MLQPKRTKHRRQFRLRHDKTAKRNTTIAFGDYGLQAITSGWINNRQIEATRIAINRKMGREGQIWIKIFPHLSKTSKPIGVRMGKGKGSPDQWIAVVRKKTVMFEVKGVPENIALEALRLGMHKLPVKSKIIKKEVA